VAIATRLHVNGHLDKVTLSDPCAFVVFGGGGDLAWRKLVPSLFNLHLDKGLPEKIGNHRGGSRRPG
jgi:glucose-6-phosphate 1-dehydrogenase